MLFRIIFLLLAFSSPAYSQTGFWQDISGNVPGTFTSTNITGPLAASGDELYLLGDTGVYRSTDGGDTFSALNTVSGTTSYDLSLTPLTFVDVAGDYIYVGRDPGSYANNVGYTPMHRMRPGDTEWTQASQLYLPDSATGDTVESIAYDTSTGTYYAASRLAGCYVSTDGLTWTGKRNGLPATTWFGFVTCLGDTVVARNGKAYLSLLGIGLTGGVYVTEDQGETWTHLEGSPTGNHGALAMSGERVLLASSGATPADSGIYFRDPDQSFQFSNKSLGESYDIRTNSTHLFTGYRDGLYFSATDGLTWDAIDTTGIAEGFEALRLEATDDTLYLLGKVAGAPTLYRRSLASVDLTPATQIAVEPFAGMPSTRYANSGTSHTFTAVAVGENISYQWKFNGAPIPGATGASLTYTVSESGTLSLDVTGADGTVSAINPITFVTIPAAPGFQDTTFARTTTWLAGSIVAYPDGKLLKIRAPGAYLHDAHGRALSERATIADSQIRRGFIDSAGRLVVWGEFTLARLDSETLADDTTFTAITFTRDASSQTKRLYDVVELPGQGYLTAVDEDTLHNGEPVPAIALYDYNGARVTSFVNPFINSSPNYAPKAIRLGITPDGKILAEIETANWADEPTQSVTFARLNNDGSRDPAFSVGDDVPYTFRAVHKFRIQPDGKILYATGINDRTPKRLLADGTYDTSFNPSDTSFENTIHGFLAPVSGDALVYGSFEAYGSDPAFGHARLRADGTLDPSYDASAGFKKFSTEKAIFDAALTAEGAKVFYLPESGQFRGTDHTGVVRVFLQGNEETDPFETFLADAGVDANLRGPEDDADGDGLPNLLEFAYQTNPADPALRAALSENETTLSGAEINAVSASAGLDPTARHYVVWIRLPKDSRGVTLTIEASTDLKTFGDGSATLVPHGELIDEGSTLLQAYYLEESIETIAKAFWRISASRS